MRPILPLLVLLALAGCRVDADVSRSVSDEFAKLQADARASGGIAVLLTPGAEARAEVSDTNSPIYGTGVSIPVKAVPADSSNPALVIKHAPTFNFAATADTPVSLAADIRMLELFGRAEIVPALPISVYLPFTDSTGLDRFNLHLGVYSETSEKWSYLRNEFIEPGRSRMRGRAAVLGTMVALEAVQSIQKNTTFYRITQAGKLVCQGELRDDGSTTTSGSFFIYGAKTGVISLKVQDGVNGTYFGEVKIATTAHADEPSGDLTMTEKLDDEDSRLTVSCGSSSVTSTDAKNQLRTLKFKEWYTAFDYGAAPCQFYAGNMCVSKQGEATAIGLFDFTDDADPLRRAQLTIDRSFSTLAWQSLK